VRRKHDGWFFPGSGKVCQQRFQRLAGPGAGGCSKKFFVPVSGRLDLPQYFFTGFTRGRQALPGMIHDQQIDLSGLAGISLVYGGQEAVFKLFKKKLIRFRHVCLFPGLFSCWSKQRQGSAERRSPVVLFSGFVQQKFSCRQHISRSPLP
jgi:hypothetical protein